MSFTTDETDRGSGLVWRAPALEDRPSTHVMIVGVGRFASSALPPLNSTSVSARALAEWFVDDADGGFSNPSRPLGSTLLLSEKDQGALSEIGGVCVPRATFANVSAALRAWIRRAEKNEGLAAILAFFSHGQAERRPGQPRFSRITAATISTLTPA